MMLIVIPGTMEWIIADLTELGVMWDWHVKIHDIDPTGFVHGFPSGCGAC